MVEQKNGQPPCSQRFHSTGGGDQEASAVPTAGWDGRGKGWGEGGWQCVSQGVCDGSPTDRLVSGKPD